MRRLIPFGLAAIGVLCTGAPTAQAACTLTGASFVATSFDLGTYTSGAGINISRTLTLRVNKSGNGACGDIRIAISRSPASATMTGPSSSSLSYDIRTTTGATLFYVGGTPTNGLTFTVPPNSTNGVASSDILVPVTLFAASGQTGLAGGTYTDASIVTASVFGVGGGGALITPAFASIQITPSATVSTVRSCTIAGVANPMAGTAVIPVSSTGRITNTSAITPTLSAGNTVSCTGTGPVSISMTSLNGRVTGPANANPSFANTIDYTASASVAGGTAATFASVTGTAGAGSAGATTGTLSVSITPIDPGKPLVAGSYSDTLSISITPQ